MNRLRDIIYKTGILEVVGSTNKEIESIAFDSRKVNPGTLFVAVKGLQTDGHLYIDQAVKSGATAIICEHIPDTVSETVSYIRVKDSAACLGIAASNFFDNPDKKLKIIGVTGTNGKPASSPFCTNSYSN
jgi:UDP-N-acetylmuramoyl-L-alanyl-D-glutamate--2,6-diaminopimelate ligase